MFYEFHHELFKDPDFLVEGVWREKMERLPELRHKRMEMLDRQRALLAPLYASTRKTGDADALLASEICPYRINTLSRMRWVEFIPSTGWGAAREFTVKLEAVNAELPAIVDQLLEQWRASGTAFGELTIDSVESTRTSRVLNARCSYYSGHWLVILWVLLSDGRWNSRVRRIHVTASPITSK